MLSPPGVGGEGTRELYERSFNITEEDGIGGVAGWMIDSISIGRELHARQPDEKRGMKTSVMRVQVDGKRSGQGAGQCERVCSTLKPPKCEQRQVL